MKVQYTYWESGDGWWIGCLDEYPDHLTQGRNLAELEEMLKDLYTDFIAHPAGVKRKGILEVA